VAEAIHLQSVLAFFEHEFGIAWETDSKVAMAVPERQGVGRIKHLEVRALWIQEGEEQRRVPEKGRDP